MSDFGLVNKKVKEGRKWRGDIRVAIDGQEAVLKVRQLLDPEYYEVLSKVDREELKAFSESLPQDELKEYRKLQAQEDLSDEEHERFVELEAMLNDSAGAIFDYMSRETFEGIRQCAKYAIVPDEEDVMNYFNDPVYVREVEKEHNIDVQVPYDLYDADADGMPEEWAGPLKDDMQRMIDGCTRFTSFTIGIQALVATVGDEGNSKPSQAVEKDES